MGQGTQGTIVGTLGYAAPEQFRGMVHYTSDLYGLGVTGVRLLTGCLPEDEGGTVVDALFDLHSMTWVWREWVAQNGVEVSVEFADILDGMIQEKVRDRISSSKNILALLGIKKPFFNIHTCLGEWQGTFGLNNASLDVTSLSQSRDNIWKLKGKLMVQGNFLGVLNNKHEIVVEIDLDLVHRTVIISEKGIPSGWFWKKAEKNQGTLVLDQHQIELLNSLQVTGF
ncbi:hypothetical protein PN462_09310 [Spirulina sp. CS-785/01]|uniref:hypothetical protein n=1 Tax=Spirulina sp. CS-785/01 TaxID=3021716 RepID=UPI002330AB58|nr:hypothetical protein [Spirulina sp. CS-785/01]MDB9313295.1 hypothetical protein [Spirulina sp. CS-785/01]